ncbi:hypothetical protein DL770_004738 [Monosporascus sp. CRB-9-2]|nr:hypothetical protein DL770_004738 [Monosporascus sp. CRB-9-2]
MRVICRTLNDTATVKPHGYWKLVFRGGSSTSRYPQVKAVLADLASPRRTRTYQAWIAGMLIQVPWRRSRFLLMASIGNFVLFELHDWFRGNYRA